jgi:predicted transcriptional regulator
MLAPNYTAARSELVKKMGLGSRAKKPVPRKRNSLRARLVSFLGQIGFRS